MTSDTAQLSPLGQKLQELVSHSAVTPVYAPVNGFPGAYVVLPVYDSCNASQSTHAEFHQIPFGVFRYGKS